MPFSSVWLTMTSRNSRPVEPSSPSWETASPENGNPPAKRLDCYEKDRLHFLYCGYSGSRTSSQWTLISHQYPASKFQSVAWLSNPRRTVLPAQSLKSNSTVCQPPGQVAAEIVLGSCFCCPSILSDEKPVAALVMRNDHREDRLFPCGNVDRLRQGAGGFRVSGVRDQYVRPASEGCRQARLHGIAAVADAPAGRKLRHGSGNVDSPGSRLSGLRRSRTRHRTSRYELEVGTRAGRLAPRGVVGSEHDVRILDAESGHATLARRSRFKPVRRGRFRHCFSDKRFDSLNNAPVHGLCQRPGAVGESDPDRFIDRCYQLFLQVIFKLDSKFIARVPCPGDSIKPAIVFARRDLAAVDPSRLQT